jgi:hypothetical protein
MQKTTKRTLLMVLGLIVGGWLMLSQRLETPEQDLEVLEETVRGSASEQGNELRVKLLLLGAEFVIQRTTQPN